MSILKRKSFKIAIIALLIVLIIVIACAIYLSDYYKADNEKIEAFLPKMTTEVYENGYISFGNADAEVGFIFYPGGKVEYESYIPLMRLLAGEGIFCVLTSMPFKLAVLDVDAAEKITERYSEIDSWYIGGHSLGGSMAASYLAENTDKICGLVLLGSYSTADLSESGVRVLSVYGSEDGVMNREKYDGNRNNLPANFSEVVIEGGCHAYFGMYGEQDGDGVPGISAEEQILITSRAVSDFIYAR